MHFPPRLLFALAAPLLFSNPVAATPPGSAPGKTRSLVNLGAVGFSQATGAWGSNATRTKQGVFIHGEATGDGSIGGKDLAFDLSADSAVELVLAVGPDNAMPKLRLVLRDADGTEIAWTVSIEGLPPQSPKTYRLPLDKPDETPEPGTEAGFNKKSVVGWRIVGDGSANAAQVLLLQIRAGP